MVVMICWCEYSGRFLHALVALCAVVALARPTVSAERVADVPHLLVDFTDVVDDSIVATTADGERVTLRWQNPQSASDHGEGPLVLGPGRAVRTDEPPRSLIRAVRKSQEITLETWLQSAKRDQDGPARIVTLSSNASQRNITLGQDGTRFDVRFRSRGTNGNGLPSTTSPESLAINEPTHVVFTRTKSGRTTIYVNGEPVAEAEADGSLENWDRQARLAFGDELTGDRPWSGTLHLVAIYARALTADDVWQNFTAGLDGVSVPGIEQIEVDPKVTYFEHQIAPLLADRCLECHDTATREGGLDLSRRDAVMSGGESGPLFSDPPSADESLMWQLVASDDMPADRAPLTDEEKQRLRRWIEDGATWSLATIDPAVYAFGPIAPQEFVRRLTADEYIETVRATLGVDIAQLARERLPVDVRADGFRNTAYNLNVDLGHVEAYADLAREIVGQMDVMQFAQRHAKTLRFTDKDMGKLIDRMGRTVLRGPMTERETIAFRGISTTVASAGGSLEEATSLILQAMLQSPRFLYRIEDQRSTRRSRPLTPFELANRISYAVWGAPPDDALMQAADDGELDASGIAEHTQRMLQDPRAIRQSLRFIEDWLGMSRLASLRPNADRFPDWEPALADDMRAETIAVFQEIVWQQNRPLSDLLNCEITFVTPRLARHYRLPVPDSRPREDGLVRVDLADVPGRSGLLTHGSVLTVGGDEASMVTRGLLVLHELLRGVVKDPPPCVNTTPVPTEPGLTQRDIALGRIADESCGGCHGKFEPLAFGLERFDGLGSYHEMDEHGNPLHQHGEILFPGSAEPVQYDSTRELMRELAGNDRVRFTILWKLTQFAMGRPLGASDVPVVEQIYQRTQRDGGTYQAALTAILVSDLVTRYPAARAPLDSTSK